VVSECAAIDRAEFTDAAFVAAGVDAEVTFVRSHCYLAAHAAPDDPFVIHWKLQAVAKIGPLTITQQFPCPSG
jgi:hypothetical protein